MSTTSRKRLLKELSEEGRNNSRLSVMFRQMVASSMSLNVADAECIDFLLEEGRATAGQLAKVTGLTSGAMTAAIDRLEKAGYVKRTHDKQDRRKVIVEPIRERLRPSEKLYETFVRDAMTSLEDFSDQELEIIIRHYKSLSDVYTRQIQTLGAKTLK